MNEAEQKNSRFAELAFELIGAKAASEFLRDVWASASPEAKQALADAYVSRFAEQVKDHSLRYRIDDAMGAAIRKHVDVLINEHDEVIKQKVAERFKQHMESTIESVCKYALEHALREVRQNFWPKLG